jgi:hypothetical protein
VHPRYTRHTHLYVLWATQPTLTSALPLPVIISTASDSCANHVSVLCTACVTCHPCCPLLCLLQPNSTSGLGIILLTALTERQWVKEDDLAADLHLHLKVVRKGMRYLEEVRRPGGRVGTSVCRGWLVYGEACVFGCLGVGVCWRLGRGGNG